VGVRGSGFGRAAFGRDQRLLAGCSAPCTPGSLFFARPKKRDEKPLAQSRIPRGPGFVRPCTSKHRPDGATSPSHPQLWDRALTQRDILSRESVARLSATAPCVALPPAIHGGRLRATLRALAQSLAVLGRALRGPNSEVSRHYTLGCSIIPNEAQTGIEPEAPHFAKLHVGYGCREIQFSTSIHEQFVIGSSNGSVRNSPRHWSR
jgi:hypothetical protein